MVPESGNNQQSQAPITGVLDLTGGLSKKPTTTIAIDFGGRKRPARIKSQAPRHPFRLFSFEVLSPSHMGKALHRSFEDADDSEDSSSEAGGSPSPQLDLG